MVDVNNTESRAFSLVEIIVSITLIATVFAGLLGTFVVVRRYVRHAQRRLSAMNIGRLNLNKLYLEVRQDTWDSNTSLLRPGETFNLTAMNISNTVYGGNYTVSNVTRGGIQRDYRQVTISVTYPGD